jgi:hypothetical protein
MKAPTRLSRRLAAGAGLTAAAILLPAAALASSAASGSTAQARQPAAVCAAANTQVWYGLPADHSAGHAHFAFQVSNIGHSTCTFFGYPGVSALNSHGIEVGKPASHSGAKVTVTLAPGATAHFILTVTNAFLVCAHPVKATSIRVFPPGQFHAQIMPLATLQCVHKSVMAVDAVHPRAGIPGFSIS